MDNHTKGDLHIHVPPDTALQISEFTSQTGFGNDQCAHQAQAILAADPSSGDIADLDPNYKREALKLGQAILQRAGAMGMFRLANPAAPSALMQTFYFLPVSLIEWFGALSTLREVSLFSPASQSQLLPLLSTWLPSSR
jgi:hypothetical protein